MHRAHLVPPPEGDEQHLLRQAATGCFGFPTPRGIQILFGSHSERFVGSYPVGTCQKKWVPKIAFSLWLFKPHQKARTNAFQEASPGCSTARNPGKESFKDATLAWIPLGTGPRRIGTGFLWLKVQQPKPLLPSLPGVFQEAG